METVDYVSLLAQGLTYASFLSGAKLCLSIHESQSTDSFSPMPFMAGVCCSALWLKYGFIADEYEIKLVNLIGLTFSMIYVGFYVVYSRQKSRIAKQLAIVSGVLLSLLWSVDNSEEPKFLSGSLASLSSLVACAAPLTSISDVFRTRCVASLPFPIIASSFAVSFSWLTYGILKDDSFIIFTNLIASTISGAQLFLFVVYPSSIPYQKLAQSDRGDDSGIAGCNDSLAKHSQ